MLEILIILICNPVVDKLWRLSDALPKAAIRLLHRVVSLRTNQFDLIYRDNKSELVKRVDFSVAQRFQ